MTILTRYLYQKHNVIYSLYVSLLLAEKDIANYWAYELYFSGFRKETVDRLIQIYKDFYISEKITPVLQKWLMKKQAKWQEDMNQDGIIATIIENIIRREPDLVKFHIKIPNLHEFYNVGLNTHTYIQKPIFIVMSDINIVPYKTKFGEYTKCWKLPKEVYIYPSLRDVTVSSPLFDIINYDKWWLYYATGSPIWRTRIKKYKGKIDTIKKTVVFPSEEDEEEFLNWYHIEPDEQPKYIQDSWIGLDMKKINHLT